MHIERGTILKSQDWEMRCFKSMAHPCGGQACLIKIHKAEPKAQPERLYVKSKNWAKEVIY